MKAKTIKESLNEYRGRNASYAVHYDAMWKEFDNTPGITKLSWRKQKNLIKEIAAKNGFTFVNWSKLFARFDHLFKKGYFVDWDHQKEWIEKQIASSNYDLEESLNELRIADKGIYVDEEFMEEVLTHIIHSNMGFFGGVGEEGQVRDAFEERILNDPELSKIFSGGLKRHVPARMVANRLYKMMEKKGLANYGDVLD
jgi:hypothetical protein